MGVMQRLHFHFSRWRNSSTHKIREFIDPEGEAARDEAILEQYEQNTSEERAAWLADIQKDMEEYAAAEPKLDPRRTMLFFSRPDEHRCTAVTAPFYRKRINRAVQWALDHGINTFLADYATPLGLMALEILIEHPGRHKAFHVYAIKSTFINKRRSYRLVKETGLEIAILTSSADYSYHDLPVETLQRIVPCAGTRYTEKGLWVSQDKIPPYILEAWKM